MHGRFDEAQDTIQIALRLDPLSPLMVSSLGYIYLLSGRLEEALAANRRALELDPRFFKAVTTMGRIYTHMGEYQRAVEKLEQGRELMGDVPTLLGALAQAYARSGDLTRAHSLMARMTRDAQQHYVPCTSFAMAHIGLGERERALDWLELGTERREASVCALGVHPGYAPLRGEPRFQAMLDKMGLHVPPLSLHARHT